MYRYELDKFHAESFSSFANGWYKNVKAERVPLEKTWFDESTDKIVKILKDQDPQLKKYIMIGLSSLIILTIIYYLTFKSKKDVEKKSS